MGGGTQYQNVTAMNVFMFIQTDNESLWKMLQQKYNCMNSNVNGCSAAVEYEYYHWLFVCSFALSVCLAFFLRFVRVAGRRRKRFEEFKRKKSQFSFKLTMTLGTILLFLIEAHTHDLKANGTYPQTYHTQTRTCYTIHWNAPTDTHNYYNRCTVVFVIFCVLGRWVCESSMVLFFFGKRSAKEWSKLRPEMLPIFFYCHPVRQESKSYFIRSVHIMNIQEYICNREWDFFHGFWYSDFITCVYIISALHTVRYRWLSCNTIPCRFYVVSFWCVLVFVLHFFSPHFVFFH